VVDPPQPTFAALGHVVRTLREEHGMTQPDLAEAAAITVVYLSYIENGRCNPSIGIMIRIARVFGVALSELFIRAERGH
jgi:HTH-type transcriptional regulator, repressor for puuD